MAYSSGVSSGILLKVCIILFLRMYIYIYNHVFNNVYGTAGGFFSPLFTQKPTKLMVFYFYWTVMESCILMVAHSSYFDLPLHIVFYILFWQHIQCNIPAATLIFRLQVFL